MSHTYIVAREKPDTLLQEHPIEIRKELSACCVAHFDSMPQLEALANTLGFRYQLAQVEYDPRRGRQRRFFADRDINETRMFWNLSELPERARPFRALSNGHIVTCYFTNKAGEITIYRPNPNAKAVYNPLPLKEHIAFQKRFGVY